jgi:hypothetical protein
VVGLGHPLKLVNDTSDASNTADGFPGGQRWLRIVSRL